MIVTKGSLLGHIVGRFGSSHDPERTKAIDELAPLKDVSQIRQFVGSTNWIRRYLFSVYPNGSQNFGRIHETRGHDS